MIRCDERNPAARALRDRLAPHLPDGIPGEDLVVVFGGDGFLLKTVAELGTDPTYVGLNAGTLGFLLNDVDDAAAVAADLRARRLSANAFPLLHATIETSAGPIVTDRAVNDVYLERASGQTARLSIAIDGVPVVESLVADGLIMATALGSTAYSFSAGGVACHPGLSILAVTPICPHHPRLHPFALPDTATVQVRVHSSDRRPVRVVVDGRTTEPVEAVTVAYRGESVRLGYLPGRDFTRRMIQKILRP